MSAGGISFDCLSTSRKATLPSTDLWGTNMNILKDPNKGIFTRRKDKVGETQEILLAQEDSGDRIAECINVYARGVNPMVGVSYNNYGNNGGQNALSRGHGGTKLPYKPEVFRPPVFRQEDLVPLSRQPRTWFYALTNPQMPNTIHQMECPDAKSSIQNKKLYHSAPSNKQYLKQLPIDMNENLMRKEVNMDLLQSNDKKSIPALPSAGTHVDKIMHHDGKHIERNKNIYEMFANKGSAFHGTVNQDDSITANLKINEQNLTGSFETNKGGASNLQKNSLELTERYQNSEIQNVLKGAKFTSKSNPNKYVDDINREPRREGQFDRLKTSVQSGKGVPIERNSYHLSTKGKVNNNILALKDGVRSVKNSNIAKFIHLDPSNIKTKPMPCIPVQTIQSQNIHRRPVEIELDTIKTRENYNISVDSGKFTEKENNNILDLSTIQTKDNMLISKTAVKTFIEQESMIGDKPEQKMRVVQTTMDTGGNKLKIPTEFYNNVQGSSRNDIQRRSGTVGQFDPRPQSVSSNSNNRVEMVDSSIINARYGNLQNRANVEFQAKGF